MVNAIGSLALLLNLISMNMTSMLMLRWLSLTGNSLFALYGLLINAPPIIIGTSIAVAIHAYHLLKIYQQRRDY